LLQTRDSGKTWAEAPAPPAPVGSSGAANGVDQIRFANLVDGWAFGPGLWSTHDGGAHWKQLPAPEFGVASLEAAAGRVHLLVFGSHIRSSPVHEDTFSDSPATLEVGAGPVPRGQIVLNGAAGWAIVVNRVVIGGARLASGQWLDWHPPCLDAGGPAYLAASSPTYLVAVCDEGLWTGPAVRIRAYSSSDGGSHFSALPADPPPHADGEVATPAQDQVFVVGSAEDGHAEINATFDGGGRWQVVYRSPGPGLLSQIGFTTPAQGFVIESAQSGEQKSLLMTRDGGHHWDPVPFNPAK
jgi:photosystem II stability/assembly factor-like uncharacterized protein